MAKGDGAPRRLEKEREGSSKGAQQQRSSRNDRQRTELRPHKQKVASGEDGKQQKAFEEAQKIERTEGHWQAC